MKIRQDASFQAQNVPKTSSEHLLFRPQSAQSALHFENLGNPLVL